MIVHAFVGTSFLAVSPYDARVVLTVRVQLDALCCPLASLALSTSISSSLGSCQYP